MFSRHSLAPPLLALTLLAACGGGGESPEESEAAAPAGAATALRYNRDFVFVASTDEGPLVVPFSFQALDGGAGLERSITGWLARGPDWDRFLEEESLTERSGGVWRVVPDGDLRVLAGGPTEVEALRFERGDRRLRLDLDAPITGWQQGGDSRFRLLEGQLSVGSESVSGPVLEILRVDRTLEDGWPGTQDYDEVFLTGGESLQLVMGESLAGEEASEGFAWVRNGETERTWEEGEVRWLEVRSYQDARRDIPHRWSIRIPGAGIEGEVTADGFDALLGPERGARRAVEVRYTVTGWLLIDGERHEVTGMIRHAQL